MVKQLSRSTYREYIIYFSFEGIADRLGRHFCVPRWFFIFNKEEQA